MSLSRDVETLIRTGARDELATALRNLAALADLATDTATAQVDVLRDVLEQLRAGRVSAAAETVERLLFALDRQSAPRSAELELDALPPAGRA